LHWFTKRNPSFSGSQRKYIRVTLVQKEERNLSFSGWQGGENLSFSGSQREYIRVTLVQKEERNLSFSGWEVGEKPEFQWFIKGRET
jgi:hypothetical protein